MCRVRIRFNVLWAVLTFVLSLPVDELVAADGPQKPNIVFILADDIGYGDLSCYGAKHAKTPNLDRLASLGCRFTDAHSPASTCTPTRAALLTGRYSWRQESGSRIAPGDAPLLIPPGTATIASVLKQAGYLTGVVGKWHLGLGGDGGPDWNGELKPGPLEIGFDYAFLMPATGDRVPCAYVENHRVAGLDVNDPIQVSYKMKVGDEPTGRENPELLKLKHTHGHDFTIINGVGRIGWMTGGKVARWTDEDMADTFAVKAISFVERQVNADASKPFFLYLATHGIHVPRVPHPRFKGTSPVGTRGDAIHELDDTVGQVLSALDRLKLTDNTLVIFTSDNGGVMDDGYEDVGSFDYHPNAPLRGTKGTLFEGGHRVPFIARWPGRIKAGTSNDTLIAHLDMTATFAALTGVVLPKGAAADSFNVLPALLGEKAESPPRPHFVAHTGGTQGPFAIRQGDWKYIQPGGGGRQAEQSKKDGKAATLGQLFDLKSDLAEQANLAVKHPEKVAELQGLLKQLISAGGVTAAEKKRPNILFAFADDWGRNASIFAAVEGAGSINDAVKTPNIDRVAREGVLFRRAYVNAPSCTPCRSSLLSGQYFWRTGRAAILQGAVWDSKIPSFPLLLHDAGYHTGQTYKVWSPGTPNDAPFGETRFAYEKAGGKFNNFSENVTQMAKKGQPLEEAKAELYRDVTGNFEAFLADRKKDQPFCYWFGPTNVHRAWERGSGRALWGIDPDSLKDKLPKFLPDVSEVREDLADYFGEIQAFDHAVGLLLKKLEEIGELDNTLVVVSGDHGPPGFTHGKCNLYDFGTNVTLAIRGAGTRGGRVLDDFVCLPDLAPTIMEIAGLKPPDVMTGRSLMPVLRSENSGQVDPQRRFVLTGRERHVEDARDGFLPYPQRAIRTKDYLYIINFEPDRWPMGNPYTLDTAAEPSSEAFAKNTRVSLSDMDASPTKAWLIKHRADPEWKPFYDLAFAKRPREELFVIADDPNQIHNVVADPKYAAVRAELNHKLMSELTRTDDPRVTGDKQFFEKPPLAGPLPRAEAQPRTARTTAETFRHVRVPFPGKSVGVNPATGMAQAFWVDGEALAHTSQFLPVDANGEVVSTDVVVQTKDVLQSLDHALRSTGGLSLAAKLNVYVTDSDVAAKVLPVLAGRFAQDKRPAVSLVQTRLPVDGAFLAIDAVAVAASNESSVQVKPRQFAILPVGPRVYVSGQAEKGMNLAEATTKTMQSLKATLQHLGCELKDVVQVKSFLTPMSDVATSEKAIADFFAPNPVPPCVFVEWQSTLPIEIEIVAAARPNPSSLEPIEFITPPGMTASPVFCRVVRANGPTSIYVSGLFSRQAANAAEQVTDVFAQLQEILEQCGSDMRHLAKATYYVSDNDASTKLNELRPQYYDSHRPPAASKAQVFGVGLARRSLTLDMIAVRK